MKTTRRRLFGLVGAVAAMATIHPSTVIAAPANPTLDPFIAPNPQPGTIDDLQAYRHAIATGQIRPLPIAGTPITANHTQVLTFKQNGCLIPIEAATTGVRGGEVHFTITADTSQLEAALERVETRARRIVVEGQG